MESGDTRSCPVCGGRATQHKRRNDRELRPEDLQITDSRYGVTLTLHRCRECDFLFADPAETGGLVTLYANMIDSAYEEGNAPRSMQMRRLLDLGLRYRAGARNLLDIGAGVGLLVGAARERGLEAMGVEPSRALVAAAPRLTGVELLCGAYPHPALQGKRFDLVYLVDVIEHVDDPVRLLRDAARALSGTGAMVVVTPDVASIPARLLGPRWWHFRLAHVGYFSPRSMKRAAARAGLRIMAHRRALWYFPLHYLAARAGRYLPLGWLNRAAERVRLLRRLCDCVVPLNLRDSSVFVLKPEVESDNV